MEPGKLELSCHSTLAAYKITEAPLKEMFNIIDWNVFCLVVCLAMSMVLA